MGGPLLLGKHRVSRNSYNPDMSQGGLATNPRGNRQSILVSQLNIQKDCIRWHFLDCVKRLLQIRRRDHLIAFSFEPVAKQLTAEFVVFNNQNTSFHDLTTGAFLSARCS